MIIKDPQVMHAEFWDIFVGTKAQITFKDQSV